jgi:hypothetical protein
LFLLAVGGNHGRQIPISRRTLPQVIEAQVGYDAVDPGIERALKPEAADVYVGAEKSFLVDILAVFLRPGEMNRKAEHGPIVLPNQFFESGGVA